MKKYTTYTLRQLLLSLLVGVSLNACHSGGSLNATTLAQPKHTLKTINVNDMEFNEIKDLKEFLSDTYAGEKEIINNFPDSIIEEILVKKPNISFDELNARIVTVATMEKIVTVWDGYNEDKYYQLFTPWQAYAKVQAHNGDKPITEAIDPQDPTKAYAFELGGGKNYETITQWLDNVSKNGQQLILDCSLAKDLVKMAGIIASGVDETYSKVVMNSSVTLKDTVKNVKTTGDYWVETNLPKNGSIDDWEENYLIPGDGVYFENDPNYPDKESLVAAGEHAIYAGQHKYVALDEPTPVDPSVIIEFLKTSFHKATKKNPSFGYPRMHASYEKLSIN